MTPQVPKTRQNSGGASSSLNKVQVQVIKSNNKNTFFSKLIVYWSVFILSEHDSLIVMVTWTLLTSVIQKFKIQLKNNCWIWWIAAVDDRSMWVWQDVCAAGTPVWWVSGPIPGAGQHRSRQQPGAFRTTGYVHRVCFLDFKQSIV